MTQVLLDGPQNAKATILLAHGAGAPMDSASMTTAAHALASQNFRVARFEFGYMASRRSEAGRKPPPKAENLQPEYLEIVAGFAGKGPLIIGGKSMGGRVASMLADALWQERKILGLLCLGYPFHPPGEPDKLRTRHLLTSRVPTLIAQGTRDQFGTAEEVPSYGLPDSIEILWLEDGDHDLKPRKSSGHSTASHLITLGARVSSWADELLKGAKS